MHEMHQGKLKSGGSGKKVTNPKQAIAIALSEARKKGEKVPENPNKVMKRDGRISGRPFSLGEQNSLTDPHPRVPASRVGCPVLRIPGATTVSPAHTNDTH